MTKSSVIRERIRRLAGRARLELSDALVESLAVYVELLGRWNQRMNLTALDDRDRGLERLVIEPVAAVPLLPTRSGRLMDIGSGGGSPAIPMRLAAPGLELCLVEAKVKKSAFLREACRQLALHEATVETARYEALLARPELHETQDLVTVRAVRADAALLRGIQAFVRPGGHVVLFRSRGERGLPDEVRPPLVSRATHEVRGAGGTRVVILEKLPLK